jgi:hypothetical protein
MPHAAESLSLCICSKSLVRERLSATHSHTHMVLSTHKLALESVLWDLGPILLSSCRQLISLVGIMLTSLDGRTTPAFVSPDDMNPRLSQYLPHDIGMVFIAHS